MKTITTEKFNKIADLREKRFRATLYVDFFVKNSGDDDYDLQQANDLARDTSMDIPNSYVGEIIRI